MRFRPYYLTPVLVAGAAAVAIVAVPTAIVVPAPPPQAGVVNTHMAGRDTGGSYCGDFCGSYSPYSAVHQGYRHPWSRVI